MSSNRVSGWRWRKLPSCGIQSFRPFVQLASKQLLDSAFCCVCVCVWILFTLQPRREEKSRVQSVVHCKVQALPRMKFIKETVKAALDHALQQKGCVCVFFFCVFSDQPWGTLTSSLYNQPSPWESHSGVTLSYQGNPSRILVSCNKRKMGWTEALRARRDSLPCGVWVRGTRWRRELMRVLKERREGRRATGEKRVVAAGRCWGKFTFYLD